jgi:hypothetical protein
MIFGRTSSSEQKVDAITASTFCLANVHPTLFAGNSSHVFICFSGGEGD